MEEAGKRNDLDVNGKFKSDQRASDLWRLKNAFQSTDYMSDMDAKRAFDSIDHLSDMTARKRVFHSTGRTADVTGLKRRFDSIEHFSDMHERKRNGERHLGFVGYRNKFNYFKHS